MPAIVELPPRVRADEITGKFCKLLGRRYRIANIVERLAGSAAEVNAEPTFLSIELRETSTPKRFALARRQACFD